MKKDGGLTKAVNRFWKHGLAAGTRAAYTRHMRRYRRWCRRHNIDGDGETAKPSELDLCFFVTSEARRGLQPGSVKAQLSAIRAGTLANGFGDPCRDDNGGCLPALQRLVRGISRSTNKARKLRKPLTVDKLAAAIKFAREATGSTFNGAALKAALSLGVYPLLRVGELVSPKTTGHNPAKGLNVEDVEFLPSFDNPNRMEVTVKNSKGDPFRNGCVLKVVANGSDTCPVTLMKRWLVIRGGAGGKGALFKLNSGKLLTRSVLQKWMRSALTLAGYVGEEHSCHSLRAGGAESLVATGFDSSVIQVMGRWQSNAFLLYLKISDAVRKEASVAMGKLKKQDFDTLVSRGRNKDSADWL